MNGTPPQSPPLLPGSPPARLRKRAKSMSPDRQGETLRSALFSSPPLSPRDPHSPPLSPTLIPLGVGANNADSVHPMALLNFYENPTVSYGTVINSFLNGGEDNVDLSDDATVATPNSSPGKARKSPRKSAERNVTGAIADCISSPISPTTFACESRPFPTPDYFSFKEDSTPSPEHDKETRNVYANRDDENVSSINGTLLSQSPPTQGRQPLSPKAPAYILSLNRHSGVENGAALCARTGENSQQQTKDDSEQVSSSIPQDNEREILAIPQSPQAGERARREAKPQVPKFFFPLGKFVSSADHEAKREDILKAVHTIYDQRPFLHEAHFVAVTKACGLPRYLNLTLFRRVDEMGAKNEKITFEQFSNAWMSLTKDNYDESSFIFALLKRPEAVALVPEDFLHVLEDVVCNHPGLEFLADNTLFQERYVETVICRIFYDNRSMSGKITLPQFKRSGFVSMLRRLEQGIDLNLTHDCFSYKHFYVIYCKFWELDQDHDLFINEEDLAKYGGYALTRRIIHRVFCFGKVNYEARRSANAPGEAKMSYLDFIWFLLSEVDKQAPTSIEYWFRCLDIDGDGIISTYELAYFYEEQAQRQIMFDIPEHDRLKFEDAICQANDFVKPAVIGQFTLQDLKQCKMAERFFDMFTNLSKLQMHESSHNSSRLKRQFMLAQRTELLGMEEGMPTLAMPDGEPLSEWCAYAEFEYQSLVLMERSQENWSEEIEDADIEELDDSLADVSPKEITMDPIEDVGMGTMNGPMRSMVLERVSTVVQTRDDGLGSIYTYTKVEMPVGNGDDLEISEVFISSNGAEDDERSSGSWDRVQRRSVRAEQQAM